MSRMFFSKRFRRWHSLAFLMLVASCALAFMPNYRYQLSQGLETILGGGANEPLLPEDAGGGIVLIKIDPLPSEQSVVTDIASVADLPGETPVMKIQEDKHETLVTDDAIKAEPISIARHSKFSFTIKKQAVLQDDGAPNAAGIQSGDVSGGNTLESMGQSGERGSASQDDSLMSGLRDVSSDEASLERSSEPVTAEQSGDGGSLEQEGGILQTTASLIDLIALFFRRFPHEWYLLRGNIAESLGVAEAPRLTPMYRNLLNLGGKSLFA